jgi:3',5'-cyclic AMP phosphodiesterase CpdA
MRSILFLIMAVFLAGCATRASPSGETVIAWTQFGQGKDPELLARALIGPGAGCPTLVVDGVSMTMHERQDSRSGLFGRMCEERRTLGTALHVLITAGSTVLLDQQLSRNPERIAVVGDTGCRITSFFDQGCNDPATWPFAQLAGQMAQQRPDLIVHLGDYYYREAPCKGSDSHCGSGSPGETPYGDTQAAWKAEFFQPARELLAKAPWVFARGNHEDCQRGGYGWTYYFGDSTRACEIVYDRTLVRLSGLTLVDVDSAHANDKYAVQPINQKWQSIARSVASEVADTTGPIVLITHIPPYAVCASSCDKTATADAGGLRAIAAALLATGRRTVVLSGHLHTFQTLDARDGLSQVIVGTGGANLDPFPRGVSPPPVVGFSLTDWRRTGSKGQEIVARGAVSGQAQLWGARYGFGILARSTLGLEMYDAAGQRQFGCDLAGETIPRCR